MTVRPDHTGAVFFHRSFSRISPNLLRKKNGMKGPAQPSPMIGQCLSGGLGWLEVECNRRWTRASLPLDAIRRPRDTPIWKLEASLKCRSCRKGRSAPPVRMIKLTQTRRDHKWVHPHEER